MKEKIELSNTTVFRHLLLIIFIFTNAFVFGQIPRHLFNEVTGESYNPKDFTIKTKPINERVGIYHFGESESEWDFVILKNGDSLIIQIFNNVWGINSLTKKETWLTHCKTFNQVKVQGNRIYFGVFSGIFAESKEDSKMIKALLLFSDPISNRNYLKDSAEVGYYNDLSSIVNFYSNYTDKDYYKLSIAVQPDIYFKGRTKQDLKIMRNTIYAKYGLIFQAGGEMEKYFKQKNWYHPFKKGRI